MHLKPYRDDEVGHEEKKGLVLYVEDSNTNWEVTKLEIGGEYDLMRAKDANEAFVILGKHKFDVILMDIELAGSPYNGIEITKILKGKFDKPIPAWISMIGTLDSTPIIYVTAYSSRYTRDELLATGAADVVIKPVNFTALCLAMAKYRLKGLSQSFGDKKE